MPFCYIENLLPVHLKEFCWQDFEHNQVVRQLPLLLLLLDYAELYVRSPENEQYKNCHLSLSCIQISIYIGSKINTWLVILPELTDPDLASSSPESGSFNTHSIVFIVSTMGSDCNLVQGTWICSSWMWPETSRNGSLNSSSKTSKRRSRLVSETSPPQRDT